MGKLKLTPAPWRWESVPGARGKKRRVLIGGLPGEPQDKILTQASDCVSTDAIHERLIAAAPDLLAACEKLLASKECTPIYEGLDKGMGVQTEPGKMWLAVRNAVAKAKGTAP